MKNEKRFAHMTEAERNRAFNEMTDEEIDFSDIPQLDDDFLNNATFVERPPHTKLISIRIETDTLNWFRSKKQYQTLINKILRTYVHHVKKKEKEKDTDY